MTGMTSIMRLIKRFVITLILSLLVLLVLNIVLIVTVLQNDRESMGGWGISTACGQPPVYR